MGWPQVGSGSPAPYVPEPATRVADADSSGSSSSSESSNAYGESYSGASSWGGRAPAHYNLTLGVTFGGVVPDGTVAASGDSLATYGARLGMQTHRWLGEDGIVGVRGIGSVEADGNPDTGAVSVSSGIGVRGELGSDRFNAYYSLELTANGGVSGDGVSMGIGTRQAYGLQLGPVYGEVANESATNRDALSAGLGIRIRR